RRARRGEDEPRERDVGHRRAGERDELGRQHRGEGAGPEQPQLAEDIIRTYGFVEWEGAEGLRRAPRGPPGADSRGGASRVCALRLRGGDGRAARGGDRPLARGDLQLLPGQVVALLRARLA